MSWRASSLFTNGRIQRRKAKERRAKRARRCRTPVSVPVPASVPWPNRKLSRQHPLSLQRQAPRSVWLPSKMSPRSSSREILYIFIHIEKCITNSFKQAYYPLIRKLYIRYIHTHVTAYSFFKQSKSVLGMGRKDRFPGWTAWLTSDPCRWICLSPYLQRDRQ